jgi:hypothetical protein
VEVPPPWLLTRCGGEARWGVAGPPDRGSKRSQALVWDVPAGNLEEGPVVAAVTTLVGALGALVVAAAAARFKG